MVETFCFELLSFRTEGKRNLHENVCKHKKLCNAVMLNGENKMLNYFYGHKPIKVTFVVDIDFQKILEKTTFCDNDPEASCTPKINKHIACGLSIFVKYNYSNSKQKQYFIEKMIV